MLALLSSLPGQLCCSTLATFRRKNGQRHSDSSCGRNSGGRRGFDTTFQDEEESSSLECRKRDVCWRFQEQTNAPLIIPASGSSAGTPQPSPKRSVRSGPSSHEAQMMLLKAISYPHLPQAGSPYCSDPNCAYCRDLRKVQEQLRNGQPISPSRKGF